MSGAFDACSVHHSLSLPSICVSMVMEYNSFCASTPHCKRQLIQTEWVESKKNSLFIEQTTNMNLIMWRTMRLKQLKQSHCLWIMFVVCCSWLKRDLFRASTKKVYANHRHRRQYAPGMSQDYSWFDWCTRNWSVSFLFLSLFLK